MSVNLPKRRLVSQEDTSMVQKPRVTRSRFSGAKTRISAYRQGYIYPFHVDEVLPGDHFKYNVTTLVRMATLVFPNFSNLRLDTFCFFVPMRLLWSNFKKFMGEQDSPTDTTAYTIPQLVSPVAGFAEFSIYDHFGLPTVLTAGQTISVNVLPMRAYSLIFHEWFRDQNQQVSTRPSTGDGPDAVGNYALLRRGKSHDYFTTCLPWQQKFTVPAALGTSAPVEGLGVLSPAAHGAGAGLVGTPSPAQPGGLFTPAFMSTALYGAAPAAGNTPMAVFADLSGITINTLRNAWMVQSLLERDARGGTRYPESVLAHFDVRTPDFRVQRPEYIGGGSSPIVVTPVANTTATGLATLGGAATAAGGHSATYAATEHGYIIWLLNIRSELLYQQGTHPLWMRSTRLDYPWPELAGLGEQAVLRRELVTTGVDADDLTVFGYQERYHEFRTMWSDVTGIMRSSATGTLHAWHLSQILAAPVLGPTFIEDNAPMDRVLSGGVGAINQQFLADILIKRDVTRPLPVFGTPATIGRF